MSACAFGKSPSLQRRVLISFDQLNGNGLDFHHYLAEGFASPVCEDLVLKNDIETHGQLACKPVPTTSSGVKSSTSINTLSQGKRKASIFDLSRPAVTISSSSSILPSPAATPASVSKKHKASSALEAAKPLAERVRPRTLDEVVGQRHMLGQGALLRNLIQRDAVGKEDVRSQSGL